MPGVAYYTITAAMTVMPVGIIAILAAGLFVMEDLPPAQPFVWFSFFFQCILLIVYFLDFRDIFTDDLDYWLQEKRGYELILEVSNKF